MNFNNTSRARPRARRPRNRASMLFCCAEILGRDLGLCDSVRISIRIDRKRRRKGKGEGEGVLPLARSLAACFSPFHSLRLNSARVDSPSLPPSVGERVSENAVAQTDRQTDNIHAGPLFLHRIGFQCGQFCLWTCGTFTDLLSHLPPPSIVDPMPY